LVSKAKRNPKKPVNKVDFNILYMLMDAECNLSAITKRLSNAGMSRESRDDAFKRLLKFEEILETGTPPVGGRGRVAKKYRITDLGQAVLDGISDEILTVKA